MLQVELFTVDYPSIVEYEQDMRDMENSIDNGGWVVTYLHRRQGKEYYLYLFHNVKNPQSLIKRGRFVSIEFTEKDIAWLLEDAIRTVYNVPCTATVTNRIDINLN